MPSEETCANCHRLIGALEEAFVWKDNIVCRECYDRLSIPAQPIPTQPTPTQPTPNGEKPETTLTIVSPAMFRNSPVLFTLCIIGCVAFPLIIIAVAEQGIPTFAKLLSCLLFPFILLCWYLDCRATRLEITTRRSILKRGILSKNTNEVRHKDVRNLKVHQDFLQRIWGVGGIEIASAGHAGVEIKVSGIPSPHALADKIRQAQEAG